MDKEDENFWFGSEISDRKGNFFDSSVGNCLRRDKRIFEAESETLDNYVENASNGLKLNIPVSFEVQSKNDYTSFADLNVKKNPETVLSKKEAEINYLKRQLTEVVDPSTTVLRIILGQPYSVEWYKSKEQKLSFLDEALKSHDGNAIIVAVLFLERTLKSSLFNLEMTTRPVAINHYIHYLVSERVLDSKTLDALSMFNRPNRAAMLKFKQAISSSDPMSKISALRKCLGSHFRSDGSLYFESYLIQSYINLLELQVPIQDNDERTRCSNEILQSIPPTLSLPNTSALSTLYYACLYHYNDPPTLLSSPQTIKKNQELSEKQFLWKAMGALIRLKRWSEMEELFVTKNWMGGRKMRSPIEFDRVVCYLQHMAAPTEIKARYCELIDDVNRRIETASKSGCHKIVLKAYRDLKDRQGIEDYQLLISHNSPEGYLATEILNDSSIKWKR